MKRTVGIERRIEKIKRDLMQLGEMRPGSLSVQRRSWGGEYCHLSYTHAGKGHTEYVPKSKRKEVERQTANNKKFRKLTKEWVELALERSKIKAQTQAEK